MNIQDKAKEIWKIYGKAIQNGVNLEDKIDGLCFGFEKLLTAIAEELPEQISEQTAKIIYNTLVANGMTIIKYSAHNYIEIIRKAIIEQPPEDEEKYTYYEFLKKFMANDYEKLLLDRKNSDISKQLCVNQ